MLLVVPAAEANLFLAPGVGLTMGHILTGSCGFAPATSIAGILAIASIRSGIPPRPQKGRYRLPALNFSLAWKRVKVESGECRQTIRLARKVPIEVGDKLYLYWKMRTPECEPIYIMEEDGDFLLPTRVVVCTDSLRLTWGEILAHARHMARLDGFDNVRDFRNFFEAQYHPKPETPLDIIRW